MFALWNEEDQRFSFSLVDNGGVEITKKLHKELLAGNAGGLRILKSGDGFPYVETTPSQGELNRRSLANAREKAFKAIAKTDITVLRCIEHQIDVPAEWVAYREALREVIRLEDWPEDGDFELPVMPEYPDGS